MYMLELFTSVGTGGIDVACVRMPCERAQGAAVRVRRHQFSAQECETGAVRDHCPRP
jgi:hypothetical protein